MAAFRLAVEVSRVSFSVPAPGLGDARNFPFELALAGVRLAVAIAFAAFGVWASFILPTHDREWQPEVAVMPRATIEGDHVRITGVRDFEYRSRDDFTVRYEERIVSLSHLTGLDFFISTMPRWRQTLQGIFPRRFEGPCPSCSRE